MRMSVRRVARAAIALSAVVAAMLAGTATPAHAFTYWFHTDDMEIHGSSTPASRFFFESSNGNWVGEMRNTPPTENLPIQARSGAYFAEIDADADAIYHTLWGSVGQTVHIDPVAGGRSTACQFSAWAFAGDYTFNIEVIDPSTWNYVAVTTVKHSSTWQYERLTTAVFQPTIADVVLRVSIVGTFSFLFGANIDDFSLTCYS